MPAIPAPRRRVPSWLRISFSVVALGFAVWFVVVPQFAEAHATLATLEGVSLPLLGIALACELCSLLAYSSLTAAVFGAVRPPFSTILRLDLVDLGINHLVPGGAPVAAAVRVRLFRMVNVKASLAMSVTTIEIVGANLTLGAMLAIGVVFSLGQFGGNGWYVLAAVAVLVLLALAMVVGWALVFHTERTVRIIVAVVARIPLLRNAGLEAFVRTLAMQLRGFVGHRRRRVAAILSASANWVFDAAALWIMLSAFGSPPPLAGVLAVYALGILVSMIPLTPGGLGIVEGVMVPALVAIGTTHPTALLGVLGWRLLEYWLPLPLAGIAFATLWMPGLRPRRLTAHKSLAAPVAAD